MSRKKQTLRERTQWVALCGLLVALMLVLVKQEQVHLMLLKHPDCLQSVICF